ncbi:hypothetical protein PBRA_004051 [Plasmodiophora brassicae]|uniref:Zinc finger PHD-type domain-containing protein n=1 Tax=Plasmodiophora brassicae TaxID=37360 RepID=A0A0G4IJM9_PLABS|nr:hypothetical protein PBRA_004051 [Plasmodiophora brassicae]
MSGANGNDSPVSSDADDGDGVQGSSDQWVTRCVCDDNSQDGFMIECEICQVWQHGDCVRVDKGKVPKEYFCELCRPDLHDARGHWVGGLRPAAGAVKVVAGKPTVVKKKKAKPKKQPSTVLEADAPSDKSAPIVPGADAIVPGASGHGTENASAPEDEQRRQLSREERKIAKIMQTIQLMEDRDKKRRRSGGVTTPEAAHSNANANGPESGPTLKRKKSRTSQASKSAADSVPGDMLGAYDLDQLKASPALLKRLFPVSPLYLGAKVWLMQQRGLNENGPNHPAVETALSSQQLPLRNQLVQQYLADPALYSRSDRDTSAMVVDGDRAGIQNEGRRSRSRSHSPPPRQVPRTPPPAAMTGSQRSSPGGSVPVSPVSFRRDHGAEEPTRNQDGMDIDTTGPDPTNAKPSLATIPRLTTIPKLGRTSSMADIEASAPAQAQAYSAQAAGRPAALSGLSPASAGPGSTTPLSNLSELMQTYMNAPVDAPAPPTHIDLPRFKSNLGGVPPSGAITSSRWSLEMTSSTASRLGPPMSFNRRLPPPPQPPNRSTS